MDNLTRNEEVERGSIRSVLTEPSNPTSTEIRLCVGQISLIRAKVYNLQEENRLLRARSRHWTLPDSGCLKQGIFQKKNPLEIRRLIWQYTLPASRIIQFTVCGGYDSFFFSGSTPPVVLHICSEFHQEALSIYRPFFTFDREMESVSRPIYFSPVCDTFYFTEGNVLIDEESICGLPEIEEIQLIALYYDPYSHYLTELFNLCPFQNLTELILVVRYFNKPVFEFRYCGSMTFFDFDAESALGPELLRR